VVARYGGEEFAIVLPNCPSEGALIVVERVRTAVASLNTVAKVTVSAGIATATGTAGADAELLMTDADEALYASKRAGRDRATLAPPPRRGHRVPRPLRLGRRSTFRAFFAGAAEVTWSYPHTGVSRLLCCYQHNAHLAGMC